MTAKPRSQRTDLSGRAEYCGLFRTPSLRNVALRKAFFHNGAIHSLRQAVEFYVERDTKPEKWYPRGEKFDDLPAQYRDNINKEAPFGGKPGDRPVLTAAEIADIVALINALTAGNTPAPSKRVTAIQPEDPLPAATPAAVLC